MEVAARASRLYLPAPIMLIKAGFFAAGLLGLYFGAEWLVRGSARLARSFGISALVVGLTVVALGTSAPELVVTSLAAVRDQGDLAIGNVVGSNVVNIAVILGIGALISTMFVEERLLRREVPFMIAASLVMFALAADGSLTRMDGMILLACFVGFIAFVLAQARSEPAEIERQYVGDFLEPVARRPLVDSALIAGGCVALVVGAHLLLDASLFFARALGVSELVIGITIVAVGTSLPELATSLVAAFRKESGIALGNAVGSNIFNVLVILGVAATVHPLPVNIELLQLEMPMMILISVSIIPLSLFGARLQLGRLEGTILVSTYVLFMWLVLARSSGGVLG
jgi:cation:H+ antiporter